MKEEEQKLTIKTETVELNIIMNFVTCCRNQNPTTGFNWNNHGSIMNNAIIKVTDNLLGCLTGNISYTHCLP